MRGRRDDDEDVRAAYDSLQGLGLGEEGPVVRFSVELVEEGRGAGEGGQRRVGGRVRRWVGKLRRRRIDVRRVLRLRVVGRLNMAPAASDWITLAEASEILEASNVRFRPETIGGWARAGKLQSIKLGGRRFVRRGEIKALVAGPRRVRADDLQPALFEELRG